jgi:hypothetical protein
MRFIGVFNSPFAGPWNFLRHNTVSFIKFMAAMAINMRNSEGEGKEP